jgi:hypothetical protein
MAGTSGAASPAAVGIKWAQDEALQALGRPGTFRFAQALVLGVGGDDDQWMATVRRGTGKGARVGALVVAPGGVAYGELVGPTRGLLGAPRRDQPRWTLVARPDDITSLEYRPYVPAKFFPYSDVTVHLRSGRTWRFGIDWCRDTDALLSALRRLAGAQPSLDGPSTAALRADGAYVAARSTSDKWQLLVPSADRRHVAVVGTDNPGRSWRRIMDEPEGLPWLTWRDLTALPDGRFRFDRGDTPTTVVPEPDRIFTTSPAWRVTPELSPVEHQEWAFCSPSDLEAMRTHQPAGATPSPGRPVVRDGELHVEGYEPYRTTEEIEAGNAALGPIAPLRYLESAVNDSILRGKDFFPPLYFQPLLEGCVVPHLRDGDRVDLAVPIVVEAGASQTAVGPDQHGKVRPAGKTHAGMIATLDDRVILAWTEGIIRMAPRSRVIAYADITAVHPFMLTAKLSTIPAVEVLTADERHVFTFTNHPDCRADLEWWRRVLVRRLTGHRPVYEGPEVVRWDRSETR